MKVSRNTVRKVIRSGATAFSYDRQVQPRRKLGAWTAELERRLETNDAKSRRERLTLLRIYEDLAELGYGGGYDAVRRYAKAWRRRRSWSVTDNNLAALTDLSGVWIARVHKHKPPKMIVLDMDSSVSPTLATRRAQPTMGTLAAPAIIRCSFSTSSATWSGACYAPATCTAPTAGATFWNRW